MTQFPPSLFIQCADMLVPKLREIADAGIVGEVSSSMTASIKIDGREERVRVTVTLDPEEEPADDC